MLTYSKASVILRCARELAPRRASLLKRLKAPLEVRQKLISSYGTEKVNSSPVYEPPVLTAMMRSEAKNEELIRELSEIEQHIVRALYVLACLPLEYRKPLTYFYIYGHSHKEIQSKLKLSDSEYDILIKQAHTLLKKNIKKIP